MLIHLGTSSKINRKDMSLLSKVLENLTTSYWIQKSNPAYTEDLNVEDKSIWLSKYKYLCDLEWGKIFLNKSKMPQNMRIKIDRSDFIKIKFLFIKGHCSEQTREGLEKYICNSETNKGLACKTYKKLT